MLPTRGYTCTPTSAYTRNTSGIGPQRGGPCDSKHLGDKGMATQVDVFKAAVTSDDVTAAASALQSSEAREQIDAGMFPYGRPALVEACSVDMVEMLLGEGADAAAITEFWRRGFWVDEVPRDVAERVIEAGAETSIHAASGLGLAETVRKMLEADPSLVSAPGGDGGTPLHFARTVDVATLLIDAGADLDARDDDHNSTPAQWRVKVSPDVTRLLLERGALPDVFLAAGLGDLDVARTCVETTPECVTYRIGVNSGPFAGPVAGIKDLGGTILQWTLGFNQSAQEVAMRRGHTDVYDLLMETTPPKYKLLIAGMLADRELATELLDAHPTLVDELDDEDKMLLAKACWETNNETEAVRLMVECGFPLGIPEHNHAYSPLHNASWSGNAEVVRLLIEHGHPVDMIDPAYNSSAAGYAIYSATEARQYTDVDYGGVIDALIGAGLDDCLSEYPVGHDSIDAVMKARLDAS